MSFYIFQKTAKHFSLCCFFYLLLSNTSFAQKDVILLFMPDSVSNGNLSELKVEGFRNDARLISTPGAIALVNRNQWKANDQTSLQAALNTVAGVTLESRGYGGSQRINIRGSFLRNPFAVRNVKLYMKGIPLSSPDGTAPLEMIDAFDVNTMEVIKGPIGSVYGSGTGGALLVNPRLYVSAFPLNTETSYMVGAFGLRRLQSAIAINKQKWTHRLSYVFQENGGYRKQEFNRKNNLTYTGAYRMNDRLKYFAYASYFDGQLALPGGLTAAQVEQDPTQANLFSIANNASLYRERLFGGISQEWKVNNKLSNMSSIYSTYSQKYNPYGTAAAYSRNGYKDEQSFGTGGRTDWKFADQLGSNLSYNINFGGEVQQERFEATEWTNDGGKPGVFKYKYDVDYLSLMGFVSADLKWKKNWLLNVGASINKMNHTIAATGLNDLRVDSTATWNAELLPRVGISYTPFKQFAIHGSVSYGNSNPTIFEQIEIQQFGSLTGFAESTGLRPEHGVNYEAGVRTVLFRKVSLDVSAYEFQLTDAILPYTQTLIFPTTGNEEEFTLYANAGRVNQRGLEASLYYNSEFNQSQTLSSYQIYLNGQYTEYTFEDYTLNDVNLNGKRIPGMPVSTVSSGVTLGFWRDYVKLNLQHYYVDRTPLENQNNDWSKAYHLLNARLDFAMPKTVRKSSVEPGFFIGVNNALDTSYTSFLQTNAAAQRYYNPAPTRNFYIGFTLKFINKALCSDVQ
jgi:iron complex outermembrane receptor protein